MALADHYPAAGKVRRAGRFEKANAAHPLIAIGTPFWYAQ
jgi:hypothetical protein